ncbi:MAG: hypothetical protein Q8M93_03260 [Polaromonas sp.]|uniref:hypothetical protein n=1 Tax=Polaromonas sp. TaxID=1869339 RepID=UPI002734F5D1|nr:hypothetical protein [Polaromonas sp.]MDP3245964.1 hypothetical protein [Polaromonas sp.]
MLNVFYRHAARLAHALFFRLATLLACTSMMWMPGAHAVEADPPKAAAAAPFEHYQGWRDDPLQDWRQANERVGEIGGWRTYLRESQPAGNDADQGHDGHHGH